MKKEDSKFSQADLVEEEETPQALFPEIFDISTLKINPRLPIIKFTNIEETVKTSEQEINVSIYFSGKIKKADIFLFVNKIKHDMFYQVSSGRYNFNNIKLKMGENLLEFFYRIGDRRSISVYSIIIRG